MTTPDPALDPPLLAADLPGVGGVIKQRPEDFLVEELPLYEPSGEGEHLMMCVEKRGRTTQDAIKRVASAFRVGRRDIGYAGLKDKHAVTRQHLTVHMPGRTEDGDDVGACLERLDGRDDLKVLWATPHGNKLKRGHHGGNRFIIAVREVDLSAVVRARPILDRLAETGVPNGYGPQRFGFRRNGHLLGRMLLAGDAAAFIEETLARPGDGEVPTLIEARECFRAGDLTGAIDRWPKSLSYDRQLLDALRKGKPPAEAVDAISKDHRHLLISALQSAIFNRVLAERMAASTLDQLRPGDLAWLHDRGAVFAVDAPTADTENAGGGRVGTLSVSPSGPMWGPGMTRAAGEVDAAEQAASRALGVGPDDWATHAKLRALNVEGARRPLRIPLNDAEVSAGANEHGPYLRLGFTLPKGAFATVVCREVMQTDVG
ncbi:MAG: tRNA pseudouridine(13) synthase TruD [Planctomycetota bacterium]